MVERSVLVQNPTGLNARTAALFVQAAARFAAKVRVANGARAVQAALAHMVDLVESQFGEGSPT